MIYFDSAATTLQKPPQVAKAVAAAVNDLGSPGRGACGPAMQAARAIFAARAAVAQLAGAGNPADVAFTGGATESLNLLTADLLGPGDAAITTVLEHNAVLRPLYKTGCALDFLGCDDTGRLLYEDLPRLLRPNTRAVVCTHGSNLLGSVTDLEAMHRFCRQHGLVLIVDAAQTLGCVPVDARLAHFTCFSGHKGLFGPQGTGGVVAGPGAPAMLFKTGGTGADSFAPHQPLQMPDMLEAGTPNTPGISGLLAGAAYVAETGLEAIRQTEQALTRRFLAGLDDIRGVQVYGPPKAEDRLAVVPLNIQGMASEEVSLRLWEDHGIATRPGSHCAPLAHRRFGTEGTGMVRFSFSHFNTEAEVDTALAALAAIARKADL